MMRSVICRSLRTASSSVLLHRCPPLVPLKDLRRLRWCSDGSSDEKEKKLSLEENLRLSKDLDQAKAFLFSPTIVYKDFAIKWDLIDRLSNENSPSWLGKAATSVAATWRDHVKSSYGSQLPNWMLPVQPSTAYFVLDVLIHQKSPQEATSVVEEFVKQHPTVNLYAQRLLIWSQSGLPNAKDKIEAILKEMDEKGIRYTRRTYAVLLRYFKDEPKRIEQLSQRINESGIIPDTAMWAALAGSYARTNRIDDAAHIWKNRILEAPVGHLERQGKSLAFIQESAAELVDGLCQRIKTDQQATRSVLKQAQSILKSLEVNRLPLDDSLVYSMMRLYAQAGRFHKTQWLYNRLRYPEVGFHVLLQALIRGHVKAKGPVANKLLERHLLNAPVMDTKVATLMYLAWAKTKNDPNAGKEATEIHFRHMKGRKDLSLLYYNALLRCLAESASKETSESVKSILKELRESGLTFDETTYAMAIRALQQCGLSREGENLFQEMVKSKTPPTLRTINTILVYHSNNGDLESALHCESILNNMNRLADNEGQEQIRPNVVTYNIVLNAWSQSMTPFSSGRIWKVYHRMMYRGIEPNMITYDIVISYLTRTIDMEDLLRAEEVLETLEKHPTLRPTRKHYYRLMKTWSDTEEYCKAELILDRRIKQYLSGNEKVVPLAANFHLITSDYIKDGEIMEATEFLKRMIRICKKHKLPNHPEYRTYKMLHDHWIRGISDHPCKEQYLKELEDLMRANFPQLNQKG